ncbi:MAG: FAD-binding protein, partial [Anaerolineae bacterium]|nr:FAD-binding protein [Anaerolineae bacterium]
HAGDVNLHPFVLIERPEDPEFMARIAEAGHQILKLCVELGGTITGEHGVGIEKRDFMPLVYNGAELSAMQDLKHLFDPDNLLNPGKIFPAHLPPITKVHAEPPTDAVFTPHNAEEAAGGLAALTAAARPVRIGHSRGVNGAVRLSTAALRDIITYTLDDLYVQVGAGMPLIELQNHLQHDGMQVALASPWPETTVGGLVSANLNGPLRMRYGGVRDQL